MPSVVAVSMVFLVDSEHVSEVETACRALLDDVRAMVERRALVALEGTDVEISE